MSTPDLQLQMDFPDATRQDWRALAEAGLRGKAFEALVSETEDGLRRGPLFDADERPEAAALPAPDAPMLDGRAWHVCAAVNDPELEHANRQLLDDLRGGASAVRIDRVPLARRADLRRVLEGVLLELVPVVLAPHEDAATRAELALGEDSLRSSPVTLGLSVADPALQDIAARCPDGWRAATVNGARVEAMGGTDVLELAVMCAEAALGYRRRGADAALAAEIATHADAHLSICKTRAARRLLGAVGGAFGQDAPVPLHAVTGRRMMQSTDAWSNLLRTTSAAFGAVVGGADYVSTRAFTDPLGGATPFAHRVARNQQLLMMEESRLGLVADAAHGSHFHEAMTEAMAQAAWAMFQEIERVGGLEDWEASGALEAVVAEACEMREARAEPVLGVTLHPVPDDVPVPEVRS